LRPVTGDAALTGHYAGLVPAGLVLACGLFGNTSLADIERTAGACRQLCRAGGTVIWTRGRAAPDRVPLICGWFEELGFERRWLSGPGESYGVGVHRCAGEPQALAPGERMFTFVGADQLRQAGGW
jgi:hypothetical protein